MAIQANPTLDSRGRKLRVMVVDDSPGVMQSLILLLRHFGFEVATFVDGAEAVSATNHFRPDALICDAHTNELTNPYDSPPDHIAGIEVASAVQRAWPRCKVIIMSGNLGPSVVLDRARELGARVQVMPKPSSPEELISALRRTA